ncbi:WXG100-like domain-containing protein [Nocardia acidivorans]|uniref:WXG100-like domain-containing protein n=1 Tax=Nocardia acidivorans TaxID=404580 RepID=UPI000AEA907C|nr:ADP-ribosyltransferase [Nocardia acidivorans]
MTALNFGMAYPKGDEDELFALGDVWNKAAAELEKLEPELKSITGQVPQYYIGDGAAAVTEEFGILLGSGDHSIAKLIESLQGLGHDARSTATEIEYTKIQEEVFALLTLATVLSLLWSFAGSAAAPAVLAAARETLAIVAENAMKRIAAIVARSGLKTLAKPLSRKIIIPLGERLAPAAQRIAALNERIAASGPLVRYPAALVKGGVGAGLMGAGLDAGTQGLQILEGHRDDGFDLKQTFQTALQWGAGGAAGGPAHELMGNLLESRVSPFTAKFVSGTVGGAVGAGGMYGAGLGTQLYDNDGNWNKVDKTFHPQLLIGGLAMGAMGGANHGLAKDHGPSAPTAHDTGTSSNTRPAGTVPEVLPGVEQPNRPQPQDLRENSGGEPPVQAQPHENGQQISPARANAPLPDSSARPGAVNAPEARTPTGEHSRPLDGSTKLNAENATRPTLSNDRAGDATAPRDTAPARPTADSLARASSGQPDVKANIAAGKQDLAAPVSANRAADVRHVAGVPGTDAPGVRAEPVSRPTAVAPDALIDHSAARTNDSAPVKNSSDPVATRDHTTDRHIEPATRAAAASAVERSAALPRESDSYAPEPETTHQPEVPPAETNWSPRPDDGWSRMTPKEVSDELARRWDVETAGFDNPNLHPEAVREFARAVDDMLARYPDVKLPKVAIEPMELEYYAEAVPHYTTDDLVSTDKLVLNEHYAVDPEAMAREMAADEADGHLVPGSSDRPIHSTLVHEFAHAIFFDGQERASDTAKYALADHFTSTRGGMDKAAFEEWVDQLSGYSFDEHGLFNPDEALAEAFTDVEYNGEASTEPAKVLYWHLLDNANQHSIAPDGFTRIPEHTIARPNGAHTSDSSAPKSVEPERHPSDASHPDETHAPDTTPSSPKVTQELRDNIEELRNRAREVLNAHDGLARVDELPNLRQQYIEQLDVLGLREPETAAAAWQLFHEYDPALAKYLVDYAHDLVPSTEAAPGHVQPHSEPNDQLPVSDAPDHQPGEPGLTPEEQAARDACDQLPQAERLALDDYAGTAYNEINRHLRFGEDLRTVTPETIDLIRSGLDKLPDHIGPVKRSIMLSPKDLEKFWYENHRGAVVEDPGFVSTSKTKFKWNPNVELTIVSATGKDISFLRPPGQRGEAEVLIPDGRQFRVLDREMGADGTLHVTWEEITESTNLPAVDDSAPAVAPHDANPDQPFPAERVKDPDKAVSLDLPDIEQVQPHSQDAAPHLETEDPPAQHLKDRFEQVRAHINDIFAAYQDPARTSELPGLRAKFGELVDDLGLREQETVNAAWQLFSDHDSTLAQYVAQNRQHLLPRSEDRVESDTPPSDHARGARPRSAGEPFRNNDEFPRANEDRPGEGSPVDSDESHGVSHESEARPEPIPLTSLEIQDEHGIPEKNQRIVQEYTDFHDLLIEVRPTNVDSVPHLQEGAMPKPMDIKDKTINQDDVDLGAPEWAKGLVGRFGPGVLKLPEEGTVSPERMEELRDRLAKRDKDFVAYQDHMQRLGARYRVTADGIVEGLFKGKYQPITGDHDLFDIRHADGTRLTAAELSFHEDALTQLDAGIQHGPHVYWEPASEFQRIRNFEDIVNKHQHDAPPRDREPLVQFRPHDQPVLEWAGKNVADVDREMIPWHVNGKLDELHAEQLSKLDEVNRRQQLDSDIARLRDTVDELTNHPDFDAETYRALVNSGVKTPVDVLVDGHSRPMLRIDRGGEFEPLLARIDGPEHHLATLRQQVESAIKDGTHPSDILRSLEDTPTESISTPTESAFREAERTDAGFSFHSDDPELADLARRVADDPDYVTVDVHVTEDGNIRVGDRTYTPEEFGDLLRQLGYDSKTPLRLIGCDAATNGVAARLAAHLDADVLAPTKSAWTDPRGRVYTSGAELDANGNRRPRIPPDGEWELVHPDGTKTRAGEDGFAPGTHEEDKHDVDPDNARERSAASDAELRVITEIYNALGEDPPRVNIGANDAAYGARGAHSVERHGSDVPLNRVDAPPGDRTIEGRIYGDPPWRRQENWSYRWLDESTMNRTVNDYLRANWENIRSDLALTGEHSAVFDAGHRIGEGFYNEGMFGVGQRSTQYAQTSYAKMRLMLVPGSPPSFMVITAFPSGLP